MSDSTGKKLISQLKIIHPNEIKSKDISLDKLWYIFLDGQHYGPYHQQELEEYLHPNSIYMNSIIIANAANMRIMTPIQSEVFCPKKLTLKDEILDKKYYFLKNGVSVGPLNESDIVEKLKSKELLFNDLISENNGKTWQKIFEYRIFNRKVKNKLPTTELKNISEEIAKNLDSTNNQNLQEVVSKTNEDLNQSNDSLIGLVKLSHRNNDTKIAIDSNLEVDQTLTFVDKIVSFLPKATVFFMICFVFIFVSYFYYSTTSHKISKNQKTKVKKLEWKNSLDKTSEASSIPEIKIVKKKSKKVNTENSSKYNNTENYEVINTPQNTNVNRTLSGQYESTYSVKQDIRNEVQEDDLPYDLIDYNEYEYNSDNNEEEVNMNSQSPNDSSRKFTLEEIRQIKNMPIEFLDEE